MSRRVDSIDDRPTKIGAAFCKHVHSIGDGFTLLVGQRRPPFVELIGDLDLPHPAKYDSSLIMSHYSYRRVSKIWSGQMSPPPASTTCSLASMAVNSTQSMLWSGKWSASPLGTTSAMAEPVVGSAASSHTSSPFLKRT